MSVRSVGFDSIRWHDSTINAEGRSLYGEEFWRTYIEHPPMVVIEAVKR